MAHADDELLSALLDGESTPEDVAHVETCDECQARLTELRGAATALAAPVTPPPAHVREAAFREAMLEVDGKTKVAGARLLPFGRKTPAAPRRPNPFSAAAALLVAVVIGAWALSTIGGGGNNATTDDTTFAAGANNAIESSAGPIDLGAGATTTLAAPGAADARSKFEATGFDGGDLGRVDDIAVVEQKYQFATKQAGCCVAQTKAATETHCPVPDGATLLYHADLIYRGETAVAHVVQIGDAQPTTRILRLPDCSLIANQEFAPTSQH